MAGINKAILVGNLGRDPEIRYTPNGLAVANFTIATTERFGQDREERTEWHRIVAFGRLAEICGEYLAKGRQVYIEGRIQTKDWEDKDGNRRTTTEIVANQMQMLGRPGDYQQGSRDQQGPRGSGDPPQGRQSSGHGDGGQQGRQSSGPGGGGQQNNQGQPQKDWSSGPSEYKPDDDDEIPF